MPVPSGGLLRGGGGRRVPFKPLCRCLVYRVTVGGCAGALSAPTVPTPSGPTQAAGTPGIRALVFLGGERSDT